MNYFPILDELFSSDSIVFMLIGLIIGIIVGIKVKNTKKNLTGFIICSATYVVCEIISNFRINYLIEMMALFIGTIAIGGFIGFLIVLVVSKVRG